MIEMSRNDDAVLRILETISKSNNLKLAYQIIDKPLVSDKLNRLRQKIEKKDQLWINTVIESLRMFCLISYLDKKEPIHADIERDHKSLIVNDNIAKTAEGLIHILELIWRMHGSEVLTSFNQFNADRARKAEQSRAQRNEQLQSVLKNIGDPSTWEEADPHVHDRAKGSMQRREQLQSVRNTLGNPNNREEAPPDLGKKVERARVEAIRKTKRNKIARNIANKQPTRNRVVVPEPSSLQQRNNFNTSTMMGEEHVPQIATIHTVKGGRKTHRKRKALRKTRRNRKQ